MNPANIKHQFEVLFRQYSSDVDLQQQLWTEIETSYSHRSRKYHNLNHIHDMWKDLEAIKEELNDWNSVQFSVFYHDIYYVSIAKDNEEQSAGIAIQRLQKIGVPLEQINLIEAQIIATKNHQKSDLSDTNFLLDADLAILGQPWENYHNYMHQVREEYKIYPDFLYRPGRKKVLKHFLEMEHIYKTSFFQNKLELQAKENLQRELDWILQIDTNYRVLK